jgi:hypothetical protein
MSAAQDLQNAALAKADSYASQMKQFVDRLYQGTTTTAVVPAVTGVLDTATMNAALSALLAQAQLNPPVPVNVAALPSVSLPVVGAPEASFPVPVFPSIPVPSLTALPTPVLGSDIFDAAGLRPKVNTPTAPTRPVIALPTTPVFRDLSLSVPVRPSTSLPAAPAYATVTMNAPVRPTATLPTEPSFANIALPDITDIVIPAYALAAPVDDLTGPSNLFSFSEVEYSSALLDAGKAKLLRDLSVGGYGIETADEAALWARAQERELRSANALMLESARQMAARGFALPPGAMLAQLASAQQDAAEKISTVSRDIALKRADMYVENRKFTFTQVRELEQLSMNAHLSLMERALNASKAVAEFGLTLFNARVAKFNALMEGFRAKVTAYDTQVRAALGQVEAQRLKLQLVNARVDIQKNQVQLYGARVDAVKGAFDVYRTDATVQQTQAQLALDIERNKTQVYTAQLDGVKAAVDVYRTDATVQQGLNDAAIAIQKNQVQIWGAQWDAAKTLVDMYRSDVAAMQGLADVERTKLEGYRLDVQAYAETLRAESLRLQSYESQVRGDLAKTDIYRSQISAQLTQAEVAKAQASVVESNARVKVENTRAAIAVASATAEVYRAQTQGAASSNEANVRAYAARTEAFRALSTIYDTMGRLEIGSFDAKTRVALENSRNVIEADKVAFGIRTQSAIAGADVLSKAIQGALNQVLGIASVTATA